MASVATKEACENRNFQANPLSNFLLLPTHSLVPGSTSPQNKRTIRLCLGHLLCMVSIKI